MAGIPIKVNIDTAKFRKRMEAVQRQVPFATAVALTKTAQDVQAELKREVSRVFDRPTPFTLASLRVKPATKQRLIARVYFRDEAGDGIPPAVYLQREVEGGVRRPKRFEKALARKLGLPAGLYAMPGKSVQLDAYGNVPRSLIVKVLAQLGAMHDTAQNQTARSKQRLRRTQARKGIRGQNYFLGRPGNGLPLAVYERIRTGFGSAVRPVFVFVDAPHYEKRLDYYGIAERVQSREFEGWFDRALTDAMATAR